MKSTEGIIELKNKGHSASTLSISGPCLMERKTFLVYRGQVIQNKNKNKAKSLSPQWNLGTEKMEFQSKQAMPNRQGLNI